jgi:RND superfamily putative drug exporter
MSLQRLARLMYRRRRLVLGAWVLILVGTVALANAVGGAFHTEYAVPGSDSQAATDLLTRTGFDTRGGDQGQLVFTSTRGVDDPEVRAAVEPLFGEVEHEVSRASVVSPYSQEGARQVSDNGRIAYAQVNLGNWWLPHWIDRILPHVHVEPASDLDAELRQLTDDTPTTVTR